MARGKRTQEDFAQAAALIVAQSGWEALTPAALAEAMGVHSTAVYRHFPSWNDLVVAVFDLGLTQLVGEVDANLPSDASPREQLLGFMRAMRAAASTDPHLADGVLAILRMDTAAPMPNFDTVSSRVAALLRQLGVAEQDLPVAYQAIESLTMGSVIVDFTGHPHHVSNRRQRRRLSGVPEFEQFTRSDAATMAVADEAFELTARLLLDSFEQPAD